MNPQIIDAFGRPHTYLRVSLTDRCNLRCFYCMPEGKAELMERPGIMSLEEIIHIAKTFTQLGVDTIRLTGGEPLIRKNFAFLARGLADLGISLKLTTNGILIDRYIGLFEEIGLKQINISLDTFDKVKAIFITKRDYHDRIMANIQRAIGQGIAVKLNIVLMKGVNDDEITEFIRFTKDRNVTIKFIEFMPFKGNRWDWGKGVGQQEILDTARANFGTIEPLTNPEHSTSVNFRVRGYLGTFAIVSTITNPFCSGCNRIRLTADGKMKNCLFATSETDLLSPLRRGEAVDRLILEAIRTKKYARDGMDLRMDPEHYEKNRSMISIGG